MTLLERRLAWQRITRHSRDAQLRVTILSSFTANPLVPYLGLELEELGLPAEVTVAPYGQIAQECLDPSSETRAGAPDVAVVWPRLEDVWGGRPMPLDDPPDAYIADLLDLVDASSTLIGQGCTVVFVLPVLPDLRPLGVGDAGNARGVAAVAGAAREAARLRLIEAGALVADADEVVRLLGTRHALDPRRAVLARIPYREEAFAEMGARTARLIKIALRGAAKVVALDADCTLWGGRVGEDGVDGIDLLENGPGEAFREFQKYLLELRRAGLLLALVSKNNEDELWPAFERPEMVLKRDDLTAWRVNWQPKSQSIVEIADELNLGTASFVFIDDSAIERGEVTHALPDVAALEMPEDPESWPVTIAQSGSLDRLPPTDADRSRAETYRQESARRELRSVSTMEQFLSSLGLVVDIRPLEPTDVPRAAQLIAKTNQFTLGGARRAQVEVASWLADTRNRGLIVSARDRFGDYGAVGVLVLDLAGLDGHPDVEGVLLDTFVLSCRAMGRGIEEAMLWTAFAIARKDVWTVVHDSTKNIPAQRFFARYGGTELDRLVQLRAPHWPSHIPSGMVLTAELTNP
jgi:FkbH-like protein